MIETMAQAAEAIDRPQDAVVRREVKQRFDWAKLGLGVYFVLFLFFLYIPMILMAILSFQGDRGQLTFPFRGPVSIDWWKTLWDTNLFNTIAEDVSASGRQSLYLSLAGGRHSSPSSGSCSRWRSAGGGGSSSTSSRSSS